jgi:hypothetical protein
MKNFIVRLVYIIFILGALSGYFLIRSEVIPLWIFGIYLSVFGIIFQFEYFTFPWTNEINEAQGVETKITKNTISQYRTAGIITFLIGVLLIIVSIKYRV